jgi:putative intracellular protease/amidase
MTTILTILTDGFADWETGLLNGVARSFYGASTVYASPGGRPVTSAGGMRVSPDTAIEKIDLDALEALVVCGGTAWQEPGAPDLTRLLRTTRENGKVIGAICDGTVAAARTGILDDVRHTSNGLGYLDGTGYKGAPLYQDVMHAVTGDKVVTASATAPVSFMAEVMRALGLADANLDFFLEMHAAQYRPRADAA